MPLDDAAEAGRSQKKRLALASFSGFRDNVALGDSKRALDGNFEGDNRRLGS